MLETASAAAPGPDMDVAQLLTQKDERVRQLEAQLLERDGTIQELRSQLDKFQSVFFAAQPGSPGHPGSRSPPRRQRMLGISAEPGRGTEAVKNEELFRHYDKNDKTRQLIRSALINNEFLRHLEEDQIGEIIECMQPVQIASSCLIIREGDVGSLVYCMEEGRVEVSKENKVLSTMLPGKIFGELAILYNCTRTASVRALEPCRLWAINRQCFQGIMMKTGLLKQETYAKMLKRIPMFKEFPDDCISRFIDVVEEEIYSFGEYIVRQGARGDVFYIITRGQAKVTQNGVAGDQKQPGQNERLIGTLNVGDYFGERALKSDDVRTANIIACSPDGVSCVTIDRHSFNQIVSHFDALARAPQPAKKVEPVMDKRFAKVRLADLQVLATLGVGGFGRVELVQIGDDRSQTYALKTMKKAHIVETRQQQHILNERRIMAECQSEFVVRLFRTFRDRKYLYMLQEVCLGGEVWTILRDRGSFDDATARFYCACILEAVEYLHTRGVIYRDLKPENMLLDTQGYAKLVDFGFSKHIGGKKTWTFCGTPEYVAPEVILNKGHDHAVDYWSLGVLMYELLTGTPPFTASDPMKTYNLILKGVDALDFPRKMTKNAINLIKKLCRENPSDRLGCGKGGMWDVRKNRWYEGFNFEGLRNRKLNPPIIPFIKDPTDSSNFDDYPEDPDPEPPDDLSGWDAEF